MLGVPPQRPRSETVSLPGPLVFVPWVSLACPFRARWFLGLGLLELRFGHGTQDVSDLLVTFLRSRVDRSSLRGRWHGPSVPSAPEGSRPRWPPGCRRSW